MGNVNGNGRDRGRRGPNDRRRQALPNMEALEARRLLSGVEATPAWVATSTDINDVKNGPLANAGPDLIKVYQDYQRYTTAGGKGAFASSSYNTSPKYMKLLGDYVAVSAYGAGSLTTYMQQLQNTGMVIGGYDVGSRLVEGLVPISKLLTVADLTQTAGIRPQVLARTASVGAANNQGETAMLADQAKTQYKVDGTGVIVGALSDSVSKVGGGLADSVKTGDLPSNVNVLFDSDGTGGADEGRAMLEQIHDIAPGAGLAYHNAFSLTGGETVMAAGIRRLATEAGAKVITDDIGFAFEPYYQDGPAAVAITDVTRNNGVTYTSSAGNAQDHGFESPFRGVTGTVTGVGAGRYMNFDPSGTNLLLPVTVNTPGLAVFQFDQPFGVVNGVTSDVDIFLIDANGNVVASGISNNIATDQPYEQLNIPNAGAFNLVVQVKAGSPDPGRIAFYSFFADVTVSKQYGNAGGINYPTTYGHPTADAAIGTAAVAWFDAPAFPSGKTPTPAEGFSSFGPGVKVYNADGSRKSSVQIQQTPVLAGADAINTSFFGSPPGSVPAGLPANNYTLPNFYGTSAAAPNVAAVAALMLDLSPASSPADIRAGLIASTIPVNGAAKGTWDVQGGYGLVQATNALAAVDNLRVVAVSPTTATGVTVPPKYLVFNFSRAVDISTLQASDLIFTAYSAAGVTVSVGAPLVSDVSNPTQVFFPLTYTVQPGFKANVAYAYTLRDGSILAKDGKPLVGFNGSFVVQDLIAPKVTNTSILGRVVTATFSEPMNPATITKNTFYLIRTGASGVFGSPTNVVVNQNPAILLGYDVATNTAILDFRQVDQSLLPSDHYGLVILDTVTDVVGNKLDGEFSNLFPSGNNKEGGSFTQDLGVIGLTPPQILSFALAPSSDTGIAGDQNTKLSQPTFVGQVQSRFPGSIGGLTVVAQFNGLNSGTLSLGQGQGGRGFTGSFDVQTTTDASGKFTFTAPAGLPGGFQVVRVIVVGASDAPPLPGLSTRLDNSFRVDLNSPILTPNANSVQPNARIGTLSTVVIDATDPVFPTDLGNPFSVPTQFSVPALNPASAGNISNYALLNLGSDNTPGGTGSAADVDYSGFITSAAYAAVGQRTQTSDPFRGTITLSFAPGLASGRYILFARQPVAGLVPGITDAAGNPIYAQDASGPQNRDFTLQFDLQPTPIYITGVTAATPDDTGTGSDPDTRPDTGQTPGSGFDLSGPKSYFEIAVPGTLARATAAPTKFGIDFSTPLGGATDYTGKVLLIRSGDNPLAASDGDFGTDPTFQSGVGYTIVDTQVTVINSVLGAEFGDPGYRNRLLIELPAGSSLPADHYRLYIPNAVRSNGTDLRIFDAFSNQLDGEFLGNPSTNGDGTYENFLGTGEIRPKDLSGDGVAGGAFETGYTIVPNGHVIFVRPDYLDDEILAGDDPDGSFAKPYSTLAPEAIPNAVNGGMLNSSSNFGPNFNPQYDRNGNHRFDRSAFVAASELSAFGPVVIVAQASQTLASKTFVLQAPAGTDPVVNDGSATVSYNTTLVFDSGSVLKFRNASLFVQIQGSSIQVRGGPNPADQVYFTSYADDTIGGDTNGDGNSSAPTGGDWGGIVLRNFDDTTISPGTTSARPIPVAPGPIDASRPKLGFSGADESLSFIDQATLRYAGGSVPQTIGYRFDAITNFNTRPAITNVVISQTGGNNSAQAAISGDVDSFREDDLARGILVRRASVFSNSINGIYVRAEQNGVAMPTDAVTHPDNPASLGGTQNYAFFSPLPYVLVARMEVGRTLVHNANGLTRTAANRFYFQPGTVVKFQRGAAIDVVDESASINLGDRTYIRQYDANHNFAPGTAGFKAADFGDAQVLFTSFFDDNATTSYRDPSTGFLTTVVVPIDSDNGGKVNLPVAGNVPPLARWGGVSITSGAVAVIDDATLQFGGGSVNDATGTIGQRDVLAFQDAGSNAASFPARFLGTTAYVTNNNFFDNLQAPISIDPNGLLATDPLRPLVSGNPFFRGNIMLRNELNGLEVLPEIASNGNLLINSVWDDTDLTYLLRTTIRLAGFERGRFGGIPLPAYPSGTGPTGTAWLAELTPSVVLTIQSSLPDSPLANGQKIPRPGESVIVKLLNTQGVLGDGLNGMPAGNPNSDTQGGAGFIAGADDGADPPVDPLVDSGYLSQIRITGVGGNETTGQQRVPVIITSVRDDTVGRTVRGVDMFVASSGNTTAPAAGDGGLIMFGALGLSDYNLFDPRDGSIIDNADIRYITRIEQQGGGWVYNTTAGAGSYADRIGNKTNTQYNTAKAMTVSNSNFSSFSQTGFLAHPSNVGQLAYFETPPPNTPVFARNGPTVGQPTLTYFVNNTFANMPIAVRIVAENTSDNGPTQDSPAEAVFLNNTFYNNVVGIQTQAPLATGANPLAHVYFITMDNIFANSTTAGIQTIGQSTGSQGQYNLFSSNAADVIVGASGTGPNYTENQRINGNAQFQDPTKGLFNLLPTSDAIDSSRSEIGPLLLGTSLQPITTQYLTSITGLRRNTGRTNAFGFFGQIGSSGDIISLPGFPLRDFKDQWVPAITGSAGAIPGPNTNAGGTYSYIPISGERDQGGYLRVDDPNRANVGFGSRPFFDTGASEYRQLNPPNILQVTAIISTPLTPTGIAQIPFYSAGNILGANQTPRQIIIQFDARLDPATINNKTIILQAAGGDGIFDNGNDRRLDLSGKLIYDPIARTVALALADSNLSLGNDVYRIQVFGSGSDVIRNPEGLPLDGENTVGGRPEGATLALPSGDNFPGGNFFLTFTIDTNPPVIIAGSFALATASDSGARDNITNVNRPSFQGTVNDIAPPANPLLGQKVFIDVSTLGNGVYDRIGVAQGTTDANGNFTATYGADQVPLFDSAYNVGSDGIFGTADDSGYSTARVRIVDQSGNVSNLGDPNALIKLAIDTKGPKVISTSPIAGAQASASSGQIAVSIAVSENIAPASLNTNTVKVTRAGGDGILGNGNDVVVAIDPLSLRLENLGSASGSQILRFTIIGATASDVYRVTLVGTGANTVTDVAANAIDGESPPLPSGNGTPGGDFNLDFIVFNPSSSRILYVATTGTAAGTGSRTSPFQTITAGLAAALPGDTVAVLPGVYTESITLKSLVKVRSAATASTTTTIVPGNALETIIRAPADATGAGTITVSGTNLFSITAFQTEISGFSIAAPLVGNSSSGPINTLSAAVSLLNSDVLVAKNYIVDAGIGLQTYSNGFNAKSPVLQSNGFIGNVIGLTVNDVATGSFNLNRNVQVINNTFAFNTYGLFEQSTQPAFGLQLADVVNNIFWQNHDRSTQRLGTGIVANGPNRMSIRNNLFSGNGPLDASPVDDLLNVGAGVVPLLLSATPDDFGNITGNPAFVSPIDPRPDGNGPGNFFLGANYDLSASSAAIDVAINSLAPATDFKNRGRVDIVGKGRAGVGPADIGAFEYNGSVAIRTSMVSNSSTTASVKAKSVAAGNSSKVTTSASVPSPSKVKANAAKAAAKANKANANKAKLKITVPTAGSKPSGPVSLVNRFNSKGR